jgi:hypothetical protein
VRGSVVEWTPERAVLLVTGLQTPEFVRIRMYVTLQRGWTGPRFEVYAHDIDSTASVALWVYAKSTGDATFQKSTGGAVAITSGGALGTFVGLEPRAALVGPGTDRAVWLSVLQESTTVTGDVLSSREGVRLVGAGTSGWVSAWLGLGARASAVADSTAHGKYGLYDARTVPEMVGRA